MQRIRKTQRPAARRDSYGKIGENSGENATDGRGRKHRPRGNAGVLYSGFDYRGRESERTGVYFNVPRVSESVRFRFRFRFREKSRRGKFCAEKIRHRLRESTGGGAYENRRTVHRRRNRAVPLRGFGRRKNFAARTQLYQTADESLNRRPKN